MFSAKPKINLSFVNSPGMKSLVKLRAAGKGWELTLVKHEMSSCTACSALFGIDF